MENKKKLDETISLFGVFQRDICLVIVSISISRSTLGVFGKQEEEEKERERESGTSHREGE